MQNQIALDLVLAEQGGICAVIGYECCTYIPHKSEHNASLSEKIKEEGAKFHHDYTDDGIFYWLKGIFGG